MKIFYTGNTPPPIGGVSIFISYFLDACERSGLDLKVNKLNSKWFLRAFNSVFMINSSNRLKRLFYVLLGKILLSDVYVVKHGNCFEWSSLCDMLTLKLVDGCLVLNQSVKDQLDSMGIRSKLITTVFAENEESLRAKLVGEPRMCIEKKPYFLLYINNANTERNGQDIYGADFIHDNIKGIVKYGYLVVVDLSRKYSDIFRGQDKILYLDDVKNFLTLLSSAKIYLRPTTTDGCSVAVLEALILGVKVLASDVVSRPSGVLTYNLNDSEDFLTKLMTLCESDEGSQSAQVSEVLTSIVDVVEFMRLTG